MAQVENLFHDPGVCRAVLDLRTLIVSNNGWFWVNRLEELNRTQDYRGLRDALSE